MKTIKKLILCQVLSCFCWMANAQDRVVPILEQFNKTPDAATANRFFDELQKAEFTDEKITFANNTPIDSLRQQVWYWAAEWLYDQQQYEQAEQYALKALPKYHPANPEKADCLNTLGCIYIRLSDFKQAANYAKQSVEIEMKGGDHDRIASSMNTLAGIMASEIYHTLGNDSKALPYAEQAIDIEQQLGRKPKLAIRLSQKGSALLGLHRYKEAEDIYRLILPEFKEMGDYHSYAIALNHLGMSLLCQKRQQEAIPYYRQAAELFSKMGDLYNEIHAHRGLYESYWDINPDSAKIELDYFDLLKDSLYTNATAEALSRYNAEFGNDQLQQENEEVRSAYQRTIIIAIVVLLIVIALAWLIVYNTRLREKRRIEALMQEISLLRTKMVQTTPQTTSEEKGTEVPAISESNEGRLFLMRVIDVVNDGFADRQWSVEVIASKLNMSVQTFRRRLMATAGESPKAFISAIQMEKAGKLLTEHPDMPIVDVAFKCGFDEASSFTHTFKRIYGLTPSQYREKALK